MIDGESFQEHEAKISVFDRGFLYGDSVFETLRTYGGRPFAMTEHLQRLAWSAERVHIALPCALSTLEDEVLRALGAANQRESMIRIMITRGPGPLGLDPTLAERGTRVIIVATLSTAPDEVYRSGVGVVTYRTQRVADATDAAGAKIGNYLIAILAMRQAKTKGAVEALIIDAQDRVVEGTSSNLFAVVSGTLTTPPETTGILPGITRARVLALARELGIPFEARALTLPELVRADEIFISSTIREIFPVVRIDDEQIATGKPGPLTLRLLTAFRSHVAEQ
jgi:branched-chain amino acid aminotransferase